MQVRRLVIALWGVVVSCGPSVSTSDDSTGSAADTGVDDSRDDDGLTATGAVGSSATAATSGADTGMASDGESSTGTDIDAAIPGTWLCTGFEDPLFLSIESVEGGVPTGTVCLPDGAASEPPQWQACGEMLEHPSLGLDIYFTSQIEHELYPGSLSLELGLDYVAGEDRLEGFLFVGDPPDQVVETCERYGG